MNPNADQEWFRLVLMVFIDYLNDKLNAIIVFTEFSVYSFQSLLNFRVRSRFQF